MEYKNTFEKIIGYDVEQSDFFEQNPRGKCSFDNYSLILQMLGIYTAIYLFFG